MTAGANVDRTRDMEEIGDQGAMVEAMPRRSSPFLGVAFVATPQGSPWWERDQQRRSSGARGANVRQNEQ